MVRRYEDKSGPYDAFDLTPPGNLDEPAILEIAKEFEIADEAHFLTTFKSWAATYRNNQAAFRNVATWKQRRDSAERIQKAATALIAALGTGAMTIEDMRTLSGDRLRMGFTEDEIFELNQSGAIQTSAKLESVNIDLDGTIQRLKLLAYSASSLLPLLDKRRAEFGDHIPEYMLHMDRTVLVNNLREFWESKHGSKFTRWFEAEIDDNRASLKGVLVPRNPCSAFVLRCAQSIDRTLTVSMIDEAMKANIAFETGSPE